MDYFDLYEKIDKIMAHAYPKDMNVQVIKHHFDYLNYDGVIEENEKSIHKGTQLQLFLDASDLKIREKKIKEKKERLHESSGLN